MKKYLEIYKNAPTLDEWFKENIPNQDLIYKKGQEEQRKLFDSVAYITGIERPHVVSSHTSKSVKLPVVAYYWVQPIPNDFTVSLIMAFVRDNFYNLNCTVVSTKPINIDLEYLYTPIRLEWLNEQRAKALKYNRQLYQVAHTVEKRRQLDKEYKEIAESDNWSWYSKYWSSSEVICDYSNPIGFKYYLAEKAFWEGNNIGLPSHCIHLGLPTTTFTFVCSKYQELIAIIDKVNKGLISE